MKNKCLWGVDIEFKMFMRKVKSLLKQTTPLQICTAPFLNSPELYVVEYGLDPALRGYLCFDRRNPENLYFWRRRLSSYFTFIYDQWLVITATWEDLAAVVSMSKKIMSSFVICLVIAREIFLI